jgi:hypothetical protein
MVNGMFYTMISATPALAYSTRGVKRESGVIVTLNLKNENL